MPRKDLSTAAFVLFLVASAVGEETTQPVALRLADGRFLRLADNGSVHADRFLPGARETFQLLSRGEQQFAFRDPNGHFLPAGRSAQLLRGGAGLNGGAGDRTAFLLVPAGDSAVILRSPVGGDVVFVEPGREPRKSQGGPQPPEKQTIRVYRVAQLPSALRSALVLAIGAVAKESLAGEVYDKTTTHRRQQWIKLPSPTLREPLRAKDRRVWSVTEQYHLEARLDGEPQIEITELPLVTNYRQPADMRLMFALEATLPAEGRVRYQVRDALSASTGFRATVRLSAAGEVALGKDGNPLALGSVELADLGVELSRLDLSNDLLNLGRAPIEDMVNRELRGNRDRIRQKANRSIAKAVSRQEFHNPLGRLLGSW